MSYHVEAVAQIRGEAAARGLSLTQLATHAHVHPRTLRKQLAGEHPLTRQNATKLLQWLDAHGPWVFAQARETLVILSQQPPLAEIRGSLPTGSAQTRRAAVEPLEPDRYPIDTMIVDLVVAMGRETAVEALLSRTVVSRGPYLGGVRRRYFTLLKTVAQGALSTRASFVAGWDDPQPPMLVRVQFHPGHPDQMELMKELARCARGDADRPDLSVVRADVFMDLPISTWTLFPSVLRARSYRRIESGNAERSLHGETLYVGSRNSNLYLRLYDLKAAHQLDNLEGPATRVEVELRFSPPLGLWNPELDFEGYRRLQRVSLHASHVPDMGTVTSALLGLARREGIAATRRRLKRDSASERRHFDRALALAADRVPLPSPSLVLGKAWHFALWQIRTWLTEGSRHRHVGT